MQHYDKNDPKTIQNMFGSIAQSYDKTNAVLSFQMHRYWNSQLIRQTTSVSKPGVLLDLCCGTGEIAFTYLKKSTMPCQVTLLDFCEEMLGCAKEKARQLKYDSQHNLTYLHADAQSLPISDNSIALATMAYGIRNVKDPAKCAREVLRVLQPGGVYGILELTEPKNPILRYAHNLYLRTFLPILGKCLTSNQEAYKYLCNSIHSFIKPLELERILVDTGFEQTKRIPLMGGIATILIAKKTDSLHISN